MYPSVERNIITLNPIKNSEYVNGRIIGFEIWLSTLVPIAAIALPSIDKVEKIYPRVGFAFGKLSSDFDNVRMYHPKQVKRASR